MVGVKFKAAVSDTDILLHLFRSNHLDMLGLIFEEIHIPEFIFKIELKNHAREQYDEIKAILLKPDSIFKIIYDFDLDFGVRSLKDVIYDENKYLADKGEVICVSYANASRINIVVSDNYTEFEKLEDIAIMLTYFDILAICVNHKKMSYNDAVDIYNKVNGNMSHPSSYTFDESYQDSMNYFVSRDYLDVLKIVIP